MQPIALLFAIFILSFVAGLGWYAGHGVVEFLAGIVGRGGAAKSAPKDAELGAQSEKKTLTVFE
jgi:hypothetical protein